LLTAILKARIAKDSQKISAAVPLSAKRRPSIAEQFAELLYLAMYKHSGDPELYEPIRVLLKVRHLFTTVFCTDTLKNTEFHTQAAVIKVM